MGWFLSSLRSLRYPSRQSRRAPKRDRSLILEDLEGRRLPSHAIQSLVTFRDAGTSDIISGPDGDLWLGVSPTPSTVAIERIGLNGAITSFPVPGSAAAGFGIVSLTTGPDGDVWFVADFNPTFSDNQVLLGKVTPAGEVTTFPPIPVPAGQGALASGIVSGPGGDLWFGYTVLGFASPIQIQSFIGRVTTAGAVTLFPISSFSSNSPQILNPLVAGADGNLWFTAGFGRNFVFGRMSPSGVVTQFPIRSQSAGEVGNGPNGSLIVTAQNAKGQNEVVRVSTAGAVTPYRVSAAISDAFSTYLGSADGSLWFADEGPAFKIGRITGRGVATSYNLSRFVRGRQNNINSMAVGPDGNLYVLDDSGEGLISPSVVYRLVPSKLPPVRGARGHTGGHPDVT